MAATEADRIRIAQILAGRRDDDFEQRILRRIDMRQSLGVTRGLLTAWTTASLFLWLKRSADTTEGKVLTLDVFGEGLELGVEPGKYVVQYLAFADVARAEIYVNGKEAATVFQDGFALPSRRAMKFETARLAIECAKRKGWVPVAKDREGGVEGPEEMLAWLREIREEEIAFRVLQRWTRKKWQGKSIPAPVWQAYILAAETELFEHFLKRARALEKLNDDPGCSQFLRDLSLSAV
ncbi:MAG: hypothetical protein JWN23_340 [Rhodocyclales bacterium]|nr:hypothetical protein [Rhodocyclales bacterium]